MKLLIVIPAYNEAENIERVVENLRKVCPDFDFLIVNDGSKDKTADICIENRYSMLNLPVNLGLAGAFQAGIKYAYLHGYDAAIQFDGDGQHDPVYIGTLLQCMEDGNEDIVIGSRFLKKRKPQTLRMLGSRLICTAIKITTGKTITDPTSGMRLFNRKMLEHFALNINYGPEPDTISYLLRCGASVAEVQVDMYERVAGTSYLTMGRSIRYMLNMAISILFVQLFRKRRVL